MKRKKFWKFNFSIPILFVLFVLFIQFSRQRSNEINQEKIDGCSEIPLSETQYVEVESSQMNFHDQTLKRLVVSYRLRTSSASQFLLGPSSCGQNPSAGACLQSINYRQRELRRNPIEDGAISGFSGQNSVPE